MNERIMMNDEKCVISCLYYYDVTNLCFVSLSDIYLFYFKLIGTLIYEKLVTQK